MATPKSRGEDLHVSEETLHIFLKDPTFVEYFNSFLLLPAFSNRLFFNSETGFFEPVHGSGMVRCEEGGVTPTSSQATLYLTDETVGPSLDKQQSWLWVIQHRLPLFQRSDLYSEYKLCKLLTNSKLQLTKSNSATTLPPRPLLKTSTATTQQHSPPFPSKKQRIEPSSSDSLPPLPPSVSSSSLLLSRDEASSISLLLSPSKSQVTMSSSRSDIELSGKTKSKSVTSLFHKQGGHSQGSLAVPSPSRVVKKTSLSPKISEADLKLLGTKSGMNALWRFLRGKAGEKNWLFWLDAEQVKYYNKTNDQQRLLRDIRERYLLPASLQKLPADTRNKLRLKTASTLTLAQLEDLQHELAQGIKEYWLPRFILHYKNEMDSSSSKPHSKTPPYHHDESSEAQLTHNYPTITTPLTPSSTPTFRRLCSQQHSSRPPSTTHNMRANRSMPSSVIKHSHTPTYPGDGHAHNEPESKPMHASLTHIDLIRPHTVDGSLTRTAKSSFRRPVSRKVWDKELTTDPCQPVDELCGGDSGGSGELAKRPSSNVRKKSSAAHYNKMAKYTLHHLPDPSSRCATSMDSPVHGSMCESRCQILSVTGTPLHSVSPSPAPGHYSHTLTASKDLYQPLLHCLIMEHRKAGGYFQNYLEKLVNMVYLHCLLFWRDVQEYKALFIGPSFSPCAVEMKAKELFGRYIAVGSTENIECPPVVVSSISINLWPSYEDLFDLAEEHSLGLLLTQWIELCSSEDKVFQMLDVVPVSARSSRHGFAPLVEDSDEEDPLNTEETDHVRGRYTRSPSPTKFHSRPPSRMRTSTATPSMAAGTDTPSSLRASLSQLQGHTHAISLNDIVKNRIELEHFKVFLNENFAAQDLMCWIDIEAFRGIPVGSKAIRDLKAKQLRSRYLNKKYFFGANSPATKEQQRQVVQAGGGGYGARLPARPGTPVLREAQKHVRRRLEKKWLSEFMNTPEFLLRNGGSLNEQDGTSQKSQLPAHTYEQSFSNSHEAILLRRSLQDKTQCALFLQYMLIETMGGSNTHPREDIEFWMEVQRYKEMYHAHTTETMLQNKCRAIIDCYIHSSSLPRLQIDIPHSLAEQIVKKSPGPYIFREAQGTVFKHLASCWGGYQNFVSGCTESEIVASLDKLERKAQAALIASRERQMKEQYEMERVRDSIPRFETEAEKQARLAKEKERAEFGDVAIAFSLSIPSHKYTYYTELPDGFYTEEEMLMRQQQPMVVMDSNQRPKTAPMELESQELSVNSTRHRSVPMRRNDHLRTKRDVNNNGGAPVVVMSLEGNKYSSSNLRKQVSVRTNVKEEVPLKPDVSDQQVLLEGKSSKVVFHHKNKKVLGRSQVAKVNRKRTRSLPTSKSVISMSLSGTKRSGFLLPEEQKSHLSIIATS